MEKLNELLEKYFRGETTLEDEKMLKQYFSEGRVSPEHEIYRPLFLAFDQEVQETVPVAKIVFSHGKRIKMRWLQSIAITGIAALVVLGLFVLQPSTVDSYAVIKGKRIDNMEFAQSYAENKIKNVNDILSRSMKPIGKIEQVRNSLQPVKKIGEAKQRMDEIHNLLQIK